MNLSDPASQSLSPESPVFLWEGKLAVVRLENCYK